MELDILFWLAIGAIYLFQMFAGRKKNRPVPGRPPVPTGPTENHPGSMSERSGRRTDGASAASAGSDAEPTLQDALREISDILSGRTPAERPSDPGVSRTSGSSGRIEPSSRSDGRSRTTAEPRSAGKSDEFRSPVRRKKESAEDRARRLAEMRKKHRTHRSKPLGSSKSDTQSDASVLDENAFERRSRPPRSSTYDDMFESPLFESFGSPIDHQELKVEILEPSTPAAESLRREMLLSRDEARRGIILSAILGPPVSRRRR